MNIEDYRAEVAFLMKSRDDALTAVDAGDLDARNDVLAHFDVKMDDLRALRSEGDED